MRTVSLVGHVSSSAQEGVFVSFGKCAFRGTVSPGHVEVVPCAQAGSDLSSLLPSLFPPPPSSSSLSPSPLGEGSLLLWEGWNRDYRLVRTAAPRWGQSLSTGG